MSKSLQLLLIFFLSASIAQAQQTVLMGSTSSVSTCNALFYDSGGQSGNYGSNQNQTITFNPQVAGQRIQIHFTTFNLSFNDVITVFDGSSTADPVLFNGTFQSPEFVLGTNPSGALTVRFVSDATIQSPGWAANVTCVSQDYQHYTIGTIPSVTTCGSLLFDAGGPGNNGSNGQNNDTIIIYPGIGGNKVVLDFSNNFYNYFTFFDGPNTNTPLPYAQVSQNITKIRSSHPTGAITVVTKGSYNQNWYCNISCQSPTISPDCTTLEFPANNATNQTNLPVLQWNNFGAGIPESYDVYFGTDPNPPLVSTSQTDNFYFTGELSLATTYYWKVISKNQSGNSASCSTFQFTTNTYEYSTVLANQTLGFCNTQVSVSNGNKFSQNGSLTLNPIAGTQAGISFNFYNGYLSTNDSLFIYNGNSVLSPLLGVYTQADLVNVNNLTLVSTSFDGNITMRLKSAYSYELSQFSLLTFCVDPNTSPSCPILNSPADGAFDVYPTVQLSWSPDLTSGGAPDFYDVYLGTSPGTTLVSSNQTSPFYDATNLQLNTTYYWEIVPKNQYGETLGCYFYTFTTVASVPFLDLFPYSGSVIQGDGIDVFYDGSGVTEINFSYSTDGGASYFPFASFQPFTNSYVWVPIPPAGSVIIRGEDAYNPAIWDTISIFVNPLNLSLNYPVNGEEFLLNEDFVIEWSSSEFINFLDFNTVFVDITEVQSSNTQNFFTYDNGGLTDNTSLPHSFSPLFPLPSGEYTLSIFPTYGSGTGSSVPFHIRDAILSYPNGGEVFTAGSTINITALSNTQEVYSLEFSSNGGNTWSLITNNFNNGGTAQNYEFSWTLPGINSNQCLIRIVSQNGQVIPIDQSNGTFSIQCNVSASITPAGPTTFCSGGSVQLNANSGSGLSYQWRLNGNNINGATAQNYTASTSGTYSVVVTSNGCSATSSNTTVTVNAAPNASITPAGPTTFCSGGSVQLNANSGRGLSYQWRLNGNNINGATAQNYTASTAGTYSVVVSNNGCSATSSNTTVTVNAAPNASITPAGPTTFCSGGSVQLNANSGSGLSYQWQLNGNNINGATNQNYTASAAGNYAVVVSNNGCSATSSNTTVTVNAAPNASITPAGPTTFCSGGSVQLNANSGSGLSYQWQLNGNNINGATNQNYTASVTGNYAVVVSNNGCSATSSNTNVTVNALPNASITPAGPTAFCSGGSVQFNANSGSGLSYQWQLNGANINGANSINYVANIGGNYSVTVSNGNCSSTSSNMTIVVNPIPSVSINANGPTTFCQGASVLLSTPIQSGLQFQWLLNGNPINGETNNSITSSASGNYQLEASSAGCTGQSNSIVVNSIAIPQPSITASGPLGFCGGSNVVLSTQSAIGNTYQWLINGFPINGATQNSYTANADGNYSVSVENNGCTGVSTPVTVDAIPSTQIQSNPVNQSACNGSDVTFSVVAQAQNIQYQWYFNGNVINGETNATLILNNINASNQGDYYAMVSGVCGTINSTQATLNVTSTLQISQQPLSQSICEGEDLLLQVLANGNNPVYEWYFNGNLIPGSNSSMLNLNNVNTNQAGSYSVNINSSCGNAISNNAVISINPIPQASITSLGNLTFCDEDSVVLQSGSADSYQWYYNGNQIPGANNQSIGIYQAGNYYVSITSNSCSADAPVQNVQVNPLPAAPVLIITPGNNICQGDSMQVSTQYNSGIVWNNGDTSASITVNTSIAIQCIYTDANGCSSTSVTENLVVNANPVAPNIVQNGNTLSSDYNSGNQWYYEGNILLNDTNAILSPTQNGNFRVCYTNANGCSACSQDYFFTTVSLEEAQTEQVQLYPNPFHDEMMIEYNSSKNKHPAQLRIYSLQGSLMWQQSLFSGRNRIETNTLSQGIYLIEIMQEGELLQRSKMIKN